MANRKLIVEIIGDSRSLERSFARSTNSAQKFKVGLGTIFKGAVGFLAVQKGADLAGSAIRAGIDEFSEATRVTAQTNAALKSTGRAANVTARQVEKLAGSLSQMSGIDDELIQQGENLLLTFKRVRNEVGKGNAIFDRATRAAVDLSVAGFGSIESTAKQLGKALNDPVRGMAALRRSGITFTKAQEDAVKAMVKANDTLGAQKLILREVESQVGGSARALGDTLPGKLNILRNAFDNIAATVIQRFEPAIKKTVDRVVDWLSKTKNQERVQKAINDTVRTAAAVVKTFIQALRVLKAILDPVVRAVGGMENAVKLLIAVMVTTKVVSFASSIATLGRTSAASATQVGLLSAALRRIALIGTIVVAIELVPKVRDAKGWNEFWKGVDEKLIGVGGFLEKGGITAPAGAALKAIAKLDRAQRNANLDQLTAKLNKVTSAGLRAAGVIEGFRGGLPGRTESSLGIFKPGRTTTRTTSSLGGEVPIVESHITVTMDSEVVGRAVTRSQQKTRRRNPPQKRGPNTGV